MPADLARVRLDNALALFDEFVQATVKHPDAATLRGLEGRFAEKLGIQPSYWSQIKSRSRQIGERLARQFEQQCLKPSGWMDLPARQRVAAVSRSGVAEPTTAAPQTTAEPGELPQDDDERFIIGLVLTYYRRHPQRARARLLDLLGEVLAGPPPLSPAASRPIAAPPPAGSDPEDQTLWSRSSAGVAPLKRKR